MNHPSSEPHLASPSYRLAALDQDFLLSDPLRGVRFMLEYAKVEQAMRDWNVRSTIVVFGSARVHAPDENGVTQTPSHARWYEQARAFARIASERGGAKLNHKEDRQNVIVTGGGPGIMEAANRGASECGAPSISFNITLPHEQAPNPYSTPDLTFRFHYFAMRKMHFAMRAAALAVFPGGFGTLDELFEILTLRQTGKMRPIPVVLFDRAFWHKLINFEMLVAEGLIHANDARMFLFADTAEEAWELMDLQGLPQPPAAPTDHPVSV